MDFTLPDELRHLQSEARAVGLAGAIAGHTEDTWIVTRDRQFSLELGRRRWLGMTWPIEHGGGGRSALERFVVFEALLATGAPLATSWLADRQIGPTLLRFGSAQQQAQHLPRILDGTSAWSLGLSEPDAGSDVAAIRTVAERRGDQFVINGQKTWTSGAAVADWLYLIARTDPGAAPHAGLSELIIDMRAPGITVVPITDVTGDAHFCEVFFEDVMVPADNLVGQLNGSFRQVMRQLEFERGGVDRLLSNRRLYTDALALADHTDPLIRQEIAAIETGYWIGRLLVLREVLGQAPPQFSAATKTFCTELEQRISDFCGRAAGAQATINGHGLAGRVSRNLCFAPGYTIMGGTTQILRNVLAERVLGLPR